MVLQPVVITITDDLYGKGTYGITKYGTIPRAYVKKRNPFRLPATSGGSEL